jgi:hypothetical protein
MLVPHTCTQVHASLKNLVYCRCFCLLTGYPSYQLRCSRGAVQSSHQVTRRNYARHLTYTLIPLSLYSSLLLPFSALRTDNTHLKSLVERLQLELANLQIITGLDAPAPVLDENSQLNEDIPPWVANSNIMSPLLVAYDSRIKVCQPLILYIYIAYNIYVLPLGETKCYSLLGA